MEHGDAHSADRRTVKGVMLVAIQFASATAILVPDVVASSWSLRALQLAALGLGAWAIAAMRLRNLRILPEVKSGGELRIVGPYRVIRHPMYTAVLVYTIAQCVDQSTTFHWSAWGILLVDLVIKLRYEEGLLCRRFSAYTEYMKSTKRLVPWVV